MNSSNINGKVLVLGDDMRIFLAVVRGLGRTGRQVHAVPLQQRAPALKSRYISGIHCLPAHESHPAEWLSGLKSVIQTTGIDLVIPCTDQFIAILDKFRSQLAATIIAIPGERALDDLFDKISTHRLCKRLGIPASPAMPVPDEHAIRIAADTFGFPLVLKPRRSYWIDRPGEWGKVHIIDSKTELSAAFAEVREPERYLAEKHFNGRGEGISVLADRGEIIQAFHHVRLREGRGTASSYRMSIAVDAGMLNACKKIMAELTYTGVCMFEFRRNPATGSWILLETNARFWGSMALPLALGINFPNLLYDLLVNDRKHVSRDYEIGVRSRNVTLDGFNLYKEALRLRPSTIAPWLSSLADYSVQPFRWIAGSEKNDSFTLDDLRPGFSEIASIAKGDR